MPTLRSILTLGVVLVAVLIDRRGITMRLVAFAATAVLVLMPESLLSAGFQMSFGAVVALVAAYEWAGRVNLRQRLGEGILAKFALYVGGVAFTSLIATLASTPYAIFHFNRLALYGLLANMIAVPIAAMWVMPWAVVAAIAMPFGLEAWALAPMGWGIATIVATAEAVAAWPGAVVTLVAPPTAAVAAASLGGLWLCLMRGRWRHLGLAGIAAGMLAIALPEPPDILVAGEGGLVAFRGEDGRLRASNARAEFFLETWARRGGGEGWSGWPTGADEGDPTGVRCGRLGCRFAVRGTAVALVRDPAALLEDCGSAALVIVPDYSPRRCAAPLVVGRAASRREGAHAFWIGEAGVRIATANGLRGERPWTRAGRATLPQ